jgi:hypothetical protein
LAVVPASCRRRIAGSSFASAPVILNLHLLRSSAVIHLLAALAVVALATNWLRDDREPVFLLGSLLVVSLSWGGFGFCFAILIILSSHFSQTVQQSKVFSRQSLSYGILALVVGILWPLSTWQNVRFNQLFAETVAEWTAVADWARDSTSTTAVFLVPNRPEGNGTAEPPASDLALSITVVFEFLSHRSDLGRSQARCGADVDAVVLSSLEDTIERGRGVELAGSAPYLRTPPWHRLRHRPLPFGVAGGRGGFSNGTTLRLSRRGSGGLGSIGDTAGSVAITSHSTERGAASGTRDPAAVGRQTALASPMKKVASR